MPEYYKELLWLAFKIYYYGCLAALGIFVLRITTDKKFLNGIFDILEPIKNRNGIGLVVLYGILKMISLSWISVIRYLSKIKIETNDNKDGDS
jgi:hypothetical protein